MGTTKEPNRITIVKIMFLQTHYFIGMSIINWKIADG